MAYLALIRHGLSKWNLGNRFTGWVDVPLSPQGIIESQKIAKEFKKYSFDVAYTSDLSRAQQTLLIILSEQNKTGIFTHNGEKKHSWLVSSNAIGANGRDNNDEIPIIDTAELNERYYGELQGMDKDAARKKYGEDKVLAWRRGYYARPPRGESLEDVYKRVNPFFKKKIIRDLSEDKNVLIVSHGNTLRAMIKTIMNIKEEDIPMLEFPTGKALLFDYKIVDEIGNFALLSDGFDFTRKVYWKKPSHSLV